MLFGYFTLAVAFFLSVVAAYYSVLGLVAIFSAAAIPVIIMGGALETGKVVAAMWLHRNWHRAPWTYKAYLLPSLLALMLLTSMGTFGYLSKAHSDQNLVSGDVTSKIALYDEKIKIARENIDANRAALKQLDAGVDQTLSRSTTEQGAERSVQIRRQQGPERTRLLRDIETEQKKIAQLNEERAPIAAEVRKVEAEVGPIKYIAALLYGDDPEANLLESAVRWVIILIVIVFDPLAIVLILAGTRHLEWEREARSNPNVVMPVAEPEPVVTTEPAPEPPTTPPPVEPAYFKPGVWFKWRPFPKKPLPAYLTKPWRDHVGEKLPPVVYTPEPTPEPSPTPEEDSFISQVRAVHPLIKHKEIIPHYRMINENNVEVDGRSMHIRTLVDNGYENIAQDIERKRNGIQADNVEIDRPDASFGNKFPLRPNRGHYHVHTGVLPSKLYKFTGSTWVEVDKDIADSYTHNEAYMRYLIDKLALKEITKEDLTETEYNMITEYIKNAKSTNNPA